MIDSITRITLNLQETNTMVSIRAKRGDTGRKLLIHLSDGSIPYHISDDCYATFTAKKPDGTKINNPCTIENNVIEYEFTDQTCTAVGTMKAEIRLYGADDKMITSACFLINVYDTVFRDGDEVDSESEMNTLDDLILRANAFLNETGKLLRWQGNWDSEAEYEANDLVLHEEVLYVAEDAIAAGTAPGSEEVTAWVPIAGMGTGSGGEVVGIASVKQTITTSASGGLNVVTVTLTDGTESEIVIRNGQPGASIQGPQGPMGPQGIRGPMGPTGATGPQGPAGPAGGDYVLTPADKEEIAEMAADLVEVPEHSGGNVDSSQIIPTAEGSTIMLTDSTEQSLRGMTIFGNTVQSRTPTPETPVELITAGADGSITVNIGKSIDDTAPQTFTVSTPNGLPGIPVSDGGNYTDMDGQHWICDEINFETGVYTKRVAIQVFDGSSDEKWSAFTISGGTRYRTYTPILKNIILAVAAITEKPNLLCNMFVPVVSGTTGTWTGVTGLSVASDGGIHCYTDLFNTSDVSLWTAYLAEHPMTVVYQLATPSETTISDAEMEAYRALHTHNPGTVITNDSDVDIRVKYIAETMAYFNEVQSFREYGNYGVPVLRLVGGTEGMSKDNVVTMDYRYRGRKGTCTLKWQGTSSLKWPKKNYTVKFDTAFEAKAGWGEQKKYCLKANFIDASHARNLVSAKLWSRVVASRGDGLFGATPQRGAVDGFPVVVEINGEFMGLYTFNIPKDGWMFSLSDSSLNQAIVCAEGTNMSQASAFRAEAKLDESDFSLEYVSDENNADWVKTSLNRLITACMNSDGTDLDTTIAQYLDWTSAIDFYIFNVLIGGYDCTTKNYLLVTLDGTKWYFSAYDMDSTFGLEWTGKGFRAARDTYPTPSIYPSLHRVMELVATYKKDALKTRYNRIRKDILTLSNMLYDFYDFASDIPRIVLEEDWRKWTTIPNTSGNTTAQILDWYRTRLEYMDSEMEAL